MEPLELSGDRDAVAKRIAEIEEKTAGEIVVHLVDRSDDYAFWRLLASGVAAVALAEAGSFFWPMLSAYALELAVGTAVLLWLASAPSVVLRQVVPKAAMAQAVDLRARAAFLEDGVHETRDASGVLILLSKLEHRVVILADAGIHARVGVDGWSAHVQTIVQGIREGRATESLLSALDAIGDELAAGFPPRPDDVNELENHVIHTAR